MTIDKTDLARIFRAESGRLIASLMNQCHDLQLSEDALQDACLQALERWPRIGVPDNPAAWLHTVARRRLIDRLRKTSHSSDKLIVREVHRNLNRDATQAEQNQTIPDERLKLIFTCCHPALSEQARVALTLKTLCGLTAREIARAFLISETTLNQRIVRAKRKIKVAAIAYEVPEESAFANRMNSVLSVIYLIFNESYSAYEGQTLTRRELAAESIRLARLLFKLSPEPEVAGLLALLLLHQSRYDARSDANATFIPLEHQDRSLWNQQTASEGRTLLMTAMASGQPGKYQIQAAISALHSEASSWRKTDWQQILLLYFSLHKLEPSPVIELNMLVALAHSGKLQQALRKINQLETSMKQYQPYFAARADLHAKAGQRQAAVADYERAIAMTQNNPERDFLVNKKQALMKP